VLRQNIGHAFSCIGEIFSSTLFKTPSFKDEKLELQTLVLVFFFLFIEWLGREGKYGIQNVSKLSQPLRLAFYYAIIACIIKFGETEHPFIYFNF
jgi:alginate O-acetyltransferase complex protein AlgI